MRPMSLTIQKACVLLASLVFIAGTTASGLAATEPAGRLVLKPDDRIAVLGNALPDRMQHSGYLEALIVAAYPDHNLVFRNLSAAGDEVATWHRSENFGTRDEWLQKVRADVVLAFYGYAESFKGPEGLPRFKADLARFIKDLRAKDYSGKGAPRIVLIGPPADEKHRDHNYPDPAANNERLRLYSAAMAEVAATNGVRFVDLFDASLRLQADAGRKGSSITVNGHYLTDEGDKLLAPVAFEAMFGQTAPALNQKLRSAINEKNWQWHQRYRTVDGYNVYGGRSRLSFPSAKAGEKISNFDVLQEEMSQRDVLTANRDLRVWAIARGGDVVVADTNLSAVTALPSNKPGANPDGSHVFLGGEEAIAQMKVHSGMKVNLFADEKQFPELINPVQMAWDTRGRLWVAVWPNYPERTPTSKSGDKLLIFEDTNSDGKADRMTAFRDDLNCPTGFQFYQDGVLLVQAPDIWFLRDTDGDGRADWMERVLMGQDSADSHHTANALALDPGGAVYLSDGVFHRTQAETAYGITRNNDSAIFRFEPRTGKFETYIPYGFANPHGRVFDYWGNDLVTDATGNNTYFGPAISGWLDYPQKHPGIREFWPRPSRPCPGTGILSSRHFPEEFQGNFLNCNVIGFQGIYRVKVTEEGSGLKGETLENLISSRDPNFRPSAVNVGPDGAIYLSDWHNPLIGHMQHHIRDPNRDHGHGRVYRITYGGRPLLTPGKIAGESISALLDRLKEPEDNVRERAKIELGARNADEVIAATKKWLAALDKNDPANEHHRMEALWVHQWMNVVDATLLDQMLRSPEPRARSAAGRVLCYWRDRVPDALAQFKRLAADENPRVRLEAVRGASFFRTAEAVDVALASLQQPMDYYLDYTLTETLRQLEPLWRQALAEGRPIAVNNPAGMKKLIGRLNTAELLKLPRSEGVQFALITRADVADATRNELLNELAGKKQLTKAVVLLNGLAALGDSDPSASAQLARQLPMQLAGDFQPERVRVMQFAAKGSTPEVRQAAWAARVMADGTVERAWPEAAANDAAFVDLLGGVSLLYDQDLRASAYERIRRIVAEQAGTTSSADVQRAAIRALAGMPINQTATYALLAGLIRNGREVPEATRALRMLPRNSWPKTGGGELAQSLIAWAKRVPVEERTSRDFVEAVQMAETLAGSLQPEQAAAARRELRNLRVPVFYVRTVREQMRYDVPRLVVEAGKPFSIVLENTDFMPHNLVVLKPGAREKIGPVADKMKPDQLDARGRPYVPRTPDILEATKLVEPGQQETLKLTAPKEEGNYEYCCTFPEHWRIMFGQLVVTRDVEGYLQEHPFAPDPAAHAGHQHHSEFE